MMLNINLIIHQLYYRISNLINLITIHLHSLPSGYAIERFKFVLKSDAFEIQCAFYNS